VNDQNRQDDQQQSSSPWGSDPIRGLDYDYLDIDRPEPTEPFEPKLPVAVEFNAMEAQDFYQRARGKIVHWAKTRGAGREITNYVLLIPDLMALFVRLMGDPSVSAALKAQIAAASAYVIIPLDLLPEAMMGPAGLIDDAIVAVIALNRVVKMMGQAGEDVLRRYWDGDEDILQVIEDLLGRADHFVTDRVWSGIKRFMGQFEEGGDVVEGRARPSDRG
jgi:uncharacterized membrane protein YkvA (DUF1232 family)